MGPATSLASPRFLASFEARDSKDTRIWPTRILLISRCKVDLLHSTLLCMRRLFLLEELQPGLKRSSRVNFSRIRISLMQSSKHGPWALLVRTSAPLPMPRLGLTSCISSLTSVVELLQVCSRLFDEIYKAEGKDICLDSSPRKEPSLHSHLPPPLPCPPNVQDHEHEAQ